MKLNFNLLVVFVMVLLSCNNGQGQQKSKQALLTLPAQITSGADQLSVYLPLLKGKKVGMMGNQTSIVGANKEHLVDVLLREKVDLRFAFAPEHGFRGDIERGEKVSNEVD